MKTIPTGCFTGFSHDSSCLLYVVMRAWSRGDVFMNDTSRINGFMDFVSELLVTFEAGAIVVACVTLLLSGLLMSAGLPAAAQCLQYFFVAMVGIVVCGIVVHYVDA